MIRHNFIKVSKPYGAQSAVQIGGRAPYEEIIIFMCLEPQALLF